jgi:hypothetical protein
VDSVSRIDQIDAHHRRRAVFQPTTSLETDRGQILWNRSTNDSTNQGEDQGQDRNRRTSREFAQSTRESLGIELPRLGLDGPFCLLSLFFLVFSAFPRTFSPLSVHFLSTFCPISVLCLLCSRHCAVFQPTTSLQADRGTKFCGTDPRTSHGASGSFRVLQGASTLAPHLALNF